MGGKSKEVCVCARMWSCTCQFKFLTLRVRTFLSSEDILVSTHFFKGLF